MTKEIEAMVNENFNTDKPIVYLSKQQMIDQERWDEILDVYGDETYHSSDDICA